MTFRWTTPPTQAWDADRYVTVLETGVLNVLESFAPRIEADMKTNALWTDRTANARQTLAAFAYKKGDRLLALVAKQQMSYGKWLELRWQGKYQIIMPTLQTYYGPVWRSVKAVVK